MSMLIGEILDNSVREHRDVTAVQWLEKREVHLFDKETEITITN